MLTYYDILNVKPDSSQSEIRKSYLLLIKKYHPDIYQNKSEATRQTQLIIEAYSVLKDPIKRFEYDSKLKLNEKASKEFYKEYENNSSKHEQPINNNIPHYHCEKCGRKDASLRVTLFIYVLSFFYVSSKKGWGKILCEKCRVKYSILWNIEVWFLGWWSIYGLFYSIEALLNNLKGGMQPEENNSTLLSILAYDLYLDGNYSEAFKAIDNSLTIKYTVEGNEFRNYLSEFTSINQKKKLKDKIFSLNPLFFTVPSLITLLFLTLYLLISSYKKNHSDYNQYYQNQKYDQNSDYSFQYTQPKGPELIFNEPELPLPRNGQVKYYTNSEAIAPLRIITKYGNNYYIKLEEIFTKKTILTIFIRGGQRINVDVPLGSYYIKYASGEKWYGEQYHFGPNTEYCKALEKFNFRIEGDEVAGYTIELIQQVGGNLMEGKINVNDF